MIAVHFSDDTVVRFGAFGWLNDNGAKEGPVLGYYWGEEVIHWLTTAQITIGLGECRRASESRRYRSPAVTLACLFAFLALYALVLDVCFQDSYQLTNPLWFRTPAIFASLTSIVAFIFCIALWRTALSRFREQNVPVAYG